MNRETPSTSGERSTGAQEPTGRSIAWQLLQIAALAALLLAGMYEVDRDAKALAERRARSALRLVMEAIPEGTRPASGDPVLEQAIESYAKVCAECAPPGRCEEAIRTIRLQRKVPDGTGPCRQGILGRRGGDPADGRGP